MPSPRILDLLSSNDPRDDIHRAVQALAEGQLAVLPLDSTYALTALATHEDAARRLSAANLPHTEGCLALYSTDAAADYLPPLSARQSRLLARSWPAPVLFRFHGAPASGLGAQLPDASSRLASPDNQLQLTVTDDEVAHEVLRLLPAPLLARVPIDAAAVVADATGPDWEGLADLIVDAGLLKDPGTPTAVSVKGDAWEIVRAGRVSAESLQTAECTCIVFVCTGNTCRSPMAAAVFRKLLAGRLQCAEEELPQRGFAVASAGLAAAPGMPASPEAVELIEKQGGQLSRHESQPLTVRMLTQADYVFTMTRAHRMSILQQYPEFSARVQTVSADGRDVSDPIGQGMEEYRRCLEQITDSLQGILQKVLT